MCHFYANTMLRKMDFMSTILFYATTPVAQMQLGVTIRPQPRNPGSPVSLLFLCICFGIGHRNTFSNSLTTYIFESETCVAQTALELGILLP